MRMGVADGITEAHLVLRQIDRELHQPEGESVRFRDLGYQVDIMGTSLATLCRCISVWWVMRWNSQDTTTNDTFVEVLATINERSSKQDN